MTAPELEPITTAEWAQQYAASTSVAVLPLHWITGGRTCSCGRADCGSPGKHPLTPHGKDDATNDPTVVAEWWRRWPTANVGLRPAPGLIVLDEDPRNGGDDALKELEQRHGQLTGTLTARTGSGGRHFWFRHDRKTPGKLAPGVDVKTYAGYVVAPPSIHASGRRYEWLLRSRPAAAPLWLRDALDPPQDFRPNLRSSGGPSGNRAVAGVLRFVLNSAPGNRNNALSWAAWRLYHRVLDGQLDETAAAQMLSDVAAAVQLPEREAFATIGSARKKVLGA